MACERQEMSSAMRSIAPLPVWLWGRKECIRKQSDFLSVHKICFTMVTSISAQVFRLVVHSIGSTDAA
jgi:hypothetical protein